MNEKKNIHFIGIGGVGMSGIALVAHQRGYKVTGSDMKQTYITSDLEAAGVTVKIGHDAANVPDDADIVVISTAIPKSNPELVLAREKGIEVWHRSHMLAELGRGRKTLACAGTHGKTTTSSMMATMVDRMGLDPSFLIGGTVDGYGTNAKCGEGEYYIVEADESDGSFVHLSPHVALITNVEADHLDHYGTLDAIYEAFEDFMSLLPADGAAIVCAQNDRLVSLARSCAARTFTYGQRGVDDCDISFEVLGRAGLGSRFEVAFPDGQSAEVRIERNPGLHNVLNACGVMGVAWSLGLDVAAAAEALSSFSGVRRRFYLVDEVSGITIVDDYAHHPTEVKATLAAARSLGYRHVHVLFQPHRYSRTASLAPMFADAFGDADSITLMDVYAAGEAPIPGVSGKTVVDAILDYDATQQLGWMPHRQEVIAYLSTKLTDGDLLITMGAGDVTAIGPDLANALRRQVRA